MESEKEEKEFPKLRSKGTSNNVGYSVEARYMYHKPANFGGVILDRRWQEIKFKKAPVGVPDTNPWKTDLIKHNLLNYSSAQALRWWFIAEADVSEQSSLCLETRIVTYEINTTHEVNSISAGEMK